MIPAAVRYAKAASLDEALELLAEPDARVLAGGQSLLPVMKLRIARPSLLVDINDLELRGIEQQDGALRIGALATWDELTRSPALAGPELAALAECARGIGDLQVRNRGTIGGSLAHADPASDMPAVLLALGATLELLSPDGARSIEATELAIGPYMTSLGPRELVTGIVVPLPAEGSGSAYDAVEHPASGFALAGAAALVRPDGTSRVAVTGIAAAPLLLGEDVDAELAAAEVLGDRFAPEPYRRHLARVVVERALARAGERARP